MKWVFLWIFSLCMALSCLADAGIEPDCAGVLGFPPEFRAAVEQGRIAPQVLPYLTRVYLRPAEFPADRTLSLREIEVRWSRGSFVVSRRGENFGFLFAAGAGAILFPPVLTDSDSIRIEKMDRSGNDLVYQVDSQGRIEVLADSRSAPGSHP